MGKFGMGAAGVGGVLLFLIILAINVAWIGFVVWAIIQLIEILRTAVA